MNTPKPNVEYYDDIDNFPFDECYNELIPMIEEIKRLEDKRTGSYWHWSDKNNEHNIKKARSKAYGYIAEQCPDRYVKMTFIKEAYKILQKIYKQHKKDYKKV